MNYKEYLAKSNFSFKRTITHLSTHILLVEDGTKEFIILDNSRIIQCRGVQKNLVLVRHYSKILGNLEKWATIL